MIADKAYAHNPTRQALRARRIPYAIPERADTIRIRKAKGPAAGRPPDFDAELHKQRNVVERCFNRLKQWRDVATRYTKRASIYQARLTIAAIMIWLG